MEQCEPEVDSLLATDGEMLARVLNSTIGDVETLPDAQHRWLLVDKCVEYGASALVDCGGLMAGLDNSDVAQQLLSPTCC